MAEYLPKKCDHDECEAEQMCKNENKLKSSPVKNDRRLECWEDLMRTRKKVHGILGDNLDRRPGELLMNAAEELRGVKEEKMILEYAKIPDPDKQRGCPGFWKFPEELVNKCSKDERSNCFVQQSHEDKCEVPLIERVGVPNRILQEKDVLPRTRNVYDIWRNMKYRQLKTIDLHKKIKQIGPHKPIMEDLIIIGSAIQKPIADTVKLETSIPQQTLTQEESPCLQKPVDQPSVIIGGIAINPESPPKSLQLHLAFVNYDVVTNKLVTKYIDVYNNGSKTLRLYWKQSHLRKLFGDIILRTKENSPFCFDKSELVVLPSQKISFPIWFKTNKPGTYSECWEIIILPKLLPDNFQLKLTGVARVGNLDDRCEHIKDTLNKTVRENLIKDALSDVFNTATYDVDEPVIYIYEKPKIFESANPYDPYDDRPLYLYDEDIVNKLGQIYEEVRHKDSTESWNYSVTELRKLVLKYDKIRVRKLRDSLDKEVQDRTKFISKQAEFENLVKQLKRPDLGSDSKRNSYNAVYKILREHITKICEEIDELEDTLEISFQRVYPQKVKAEIPSDITPEQFIDSMEVSGFRSDSRPKYNQRRRPEFLKDIPEYDYERRYRAYYGLGSATKIAGSKGKKGKEKKAKKEKGKSGKGNGEKGKKEKEKKGKNQPSSQKGDKKPTMEKSKNESQYFDPFVDVFCKTSTQTSIAQMSESSSMSSITMKFPKSILEQYSAYLYLIFYRKLCMAIDAIEETLKGDKITVLPSATIRRIEECKNWYESKNKIADLKEVMPDLLELEQSDGLQPNLDSPNLSPKVSVRNVFNAYSSRSEISMRNKLIKISYPERMVIEKSSTGVSLKNISTSTLEGGVLDPNWEDFKTLEIQTEAEDKTDLVAMIEYLNEKTSVEELFLKKSSSCQKNEDEYVSDEEYFYKSTEDTDNVK